MPKYSYIAKTKDGKSIRDTEEFSNQVELINNLKNRGLYILSVKEVQIKESVGGQSLKGFFTFSKKAKRSSLGLYDLANLARNLSIMLSSGVTLLRSLEILSNQTDSAKLDKILQDCSNHVKAGLAFKEAIARHPKVFNLFWQGIIEVGEASGNLPFVLEKLADYLEMRREFQRKVVSAIIYPCILLGASIIALFIFFWFILPKFSILFEQFNIEMPLLTSIIINISKFINHNIIFILIALIGGTALSIYLYRQPKFKKDWDKVFLNLPIIGKVVLLSSLERLTSTIYILLDSGLPLVYTLEIASRSIGNSVLESKIVAIKDKVRAGSSLSDEFKKSEMFPLLISEMAKIGEETGSLPIVFQKISLHYKKELTTKIERMVTFFEPLMIIFMGLLIGCIVISLFIPMFKVSTLGGAG